MTRTTTGLCIAAALGFAVSLGAQSPTTATTSPDQRTMRSDKSGHEVTVTGCLARGADGTFMLNNAKADDSSHSSASTTTATSPNPTTTAAGATTTAGTTGTTGSSRVGTTAAEPSGAAAAAMSWKLEGGKDLERHVGHKIQVTGQTDFNEHSSMSSTAGTAGTTAAAGSTTTAKGMTEPKLEVSSIKMIAASCQ